MKQFVVSIIRFPFGLFFFATRYAGLIFSDRNSEISQSILTGDLSPKAIWDWMLARDWR